MAKNKDGKKKKGADIEVRPLTMTLPVQLTVEEQSERGQRLGKLLDKIDRLKLLKKTVDAAINLQIEGIEQGPGEGSGSAVKLSVIAIQFEKTEEGLGECTDGVSRLRNIVRSEREDREVPCEEHYNFTTGEVSTVRNDTGEVFKSRSMTDIERQKKIPFPEKDEPRSPAKGKGGDPFAPDEGKDNQTEEGDSTTGEDEGKTP